MQAHVVPITGAIQFAADPAFIRALHRDFYANASEAMLTIEGVGHCFVMTPSEWRTGSRQEVQGFLQRDTALNALQQGRQVKQFEMYPTWSRHIDRNHVANVSSPSNDKLPRPSRSACRGASACPMSRLY